MTPEQGAIVLMLLTLVIWISADMVVMRLARRDVASWRLIAAKAMEEVGALERALEERAPHITVQPSGVRLTRLELPEDFWPPMHSDPAIDAMARAHRYSRTELPGTALEFLDCLHRCGYELIKFRHSDLDHTHGHRVLEDLEASSQGEGAAPEPTTVEEGPGAGDPGPGPAGKSSRAPAGPPAAEQSPGLMWRADRAPVEPP